MLTCLWLAWKIWMRRRCAARRSPKSSRRPCWSCSETRYPPNNDNDKNDNTAIIISSNYRHTAPRRWAPPRPPPLYRHRRACRRRFKKQRVDTKFPTRPADAKFLLAPPKTRFHRQARHGIPRPRRWILSRCCAGAVSLGRLRAAHRGGT